MQSYVGPASLVSLLFAGIRLDRETFERVAGEPRATHQTIAVTMLAAIAQAAFVAPRSGDPLAPVVVLAMVFALAGLLVRALVLWVVGRAGLAAERGSLGTALRPLGLAAAPGVFFVFGAFLEAAGPSGRWLAETVLDPGLGAWLFVATVVAIRAALRRGWPVAILMAVLFRIVEREVDIFVARP